MDLSFDQHRALHSANVGISVAPGCGIYAVGWPNPTLAVATIMYPGGKRVWEIRSYDERGIIRGMEYGHFADCDETYSLQASLRSI
jgi:hypothetical protein